MCYPHRDHHQRSLHHALHEARRQVLPTARRDERGQATAEYALVLLAAAALAGLLLAWASSTDGVDRLMNAVLDQLIGDVTS